MRKEVKDLLSNIRIKECENKIKKAGGMAVGNFIIASVFLSVFGFITPTSNVKTIVLCNSIIFIVCTIYNYLKLE